MEWISFIAGVLIGGMVSAYIRGWMDVPPEDDA